MINVGSQDNQINITVSSGGSSSSVNATPDTALFYSEKSREWAVSERIVDSSDYSSKYYANKSQESATKASNSEKNAEKTYNNVVQVANSFTGDIDSVKTEVLEGLDTKEQEIIANLNNKQQKAIQDIESTESNAVKEITAITNAGVEEINKIGIDSRANLDLSNLSKEGKSKFLNATNPVFCANSGNVDENGNASLLINQENTLSFKVGGDYPNLVATSTEKTFEKSYLAPITAETDGTFNVFVSEDETYVLENNIYRQKTEPTAVENDVWLNTSVQPYKAYKFNGTEWINFVDVPIGSMAVEGGVIASVETFEYNQIIKKEEIMSWGMPDYDNGIILNGVSSMPFTAPANGVLSANVQSAGEQSLYINGNLAWRKDSTAGTYGWAFTVLVSKGDVVTQNNLNTATKFYYFPMKGAN